MSVKLQSPVTEINGYRVRPGMYNEMVLPSDEQLRAELSKMNFCTPEQAEFNAWRREHAKDCQTCKGRGYTRKLPNVGCHTCKGVGYVGDK